MIDTCSICGTIYHPMPVYVLAQSEPSPPGKARPANRALRFYWTQDWETAPKKTPEPETEEESSDLPPIIHICHFRYDSETQKLDLNWMECRQKAEELGYVFRPDLTPVR